MPIYDITVSVNVLGKYRVDAGSLEEAKDEAENDFVTQLLSGLNFKVDGEESDDQESGADLYAGGNQYVKQPAVWPNPVPVRNKTADLQPIAMLKKRFSWK